MGDWPHAPSRKIQDAGTYIVTSGTLHKQFIFDSDEKLDILQDLLLATTKELGWKLEAWAIFANHYHFVGTSPDEGLGLTRLTRKIHGKSAIEINKIDGSPGSVVWFRSWPTLITNQAAYLARLAYVHFNPVKHGLVEDPKNYRWCSAAWFEKTAPSALFKTVTSMKYDRVNVEDEF